MTVTTLSECTTADYWQCNGQVSQKTLVLTAGSQVKCSMFVGQPACGYWPPVSGGAELQCSRVRRGLNTPTSAQHRSRHPSAPWTRDTWHVTARDMATSSLHSLIFRAKVNIKGGTIAKKVAELLRNMWICPHRLTWSDFCSECKISQLQVYFYINANVR